MGAEVTGPRIGSLFSGYGGLEEGARSVLGGTVAWHSEIDPGACKVLAHRYPDVPNLGDITQVDWVSVPRVDVLTGGSPCQDVSDAGKRAGMRAGTRSGLWASMCDAVDIIRPSLVIWENVRGVLSADADSSMEPCPICVGDERESHLRALGRVVGDLSELGYVGRWAGVRASDVGAPHGRFRVFVTAWPADTDITGLERHEPARGHVLPRWGSTADTDIVGVDRSGVHRSVTRWWQEPAHGGRTTTYTQGDGRHEGRPEPTRFVGGSDASISGAVTAHAAGSERGGTQPDGLGAPTQRATEPRELSSQDWGPFAPAVRRWERVTRLAPPPTEHGRKGQPRLSPRFVEWMQGLPEGWVTDVPGITRNEALRALGNGVVPQQGAHALRLLLSAPVALDGAA